MKRALTACCLLVAAALTLAACGGSAKTATTPSSSSSKPKLSAAAACADFAKWAAQFPPGSSMANAAKVAPLLIATSEAPSGPLYQDLSTLEANVLTAAKATGSLGQAEENMVVVDAANVENQDCASVNPGS
jgi:hypothetical protein